MSNLSKNPVRTGERDGKWFYRFEKARVDGKRQRAQKGGFATEEEALEAGYKAYEMYETGGRHPGDGRMSFADFLDLWYENTRLYARNNTLETREKNIRLHIKPALGSYRLTSISPLLVDKFVRDKRLAGYSFETVDRMLGTIRTALDYAIWPMELIKENPAKLIHTPGKNFAPLTHREPRRRIEDAELQQIFQRYPFGNPTICPWLSVCTSVHA